MRTRSLSLAWPVAGAGAPLAHADDLIQIYQEARASDPQLAGAEATKLRHRAKTSIRRVRHCCRRSAPLSITRDEPWQQRHGRAVRQRPSRQPEAGPITSSVKQLRPHAERHARTRASSISAMDGAEIEQGAQRKAGDATYDAAQQDLLIRVATAYFDVLTAEDALKFAHANEQALNRQMEQAQQRFEVGLSAITDVNDAKAQHDTAVANVITAQNTLDDNARSAAPADQQGARRSQEAARRAAAGSSRIRKIRMHWVDVAIKQNPSLSSYCVPARCGQRQHQYGARRPPADHQRPGHLFEKHRPGRTNSASSFGDAFHTNSTAWTTTVGLTLNVPIFSGGYTQSRVRQSIYNRDFAQDQYELQKRLIERSTRNSYRAVIAGASQVEATRQAVISAQSSLDATQAGYEVGTRTIVDVLISQQTAAAGAEQLLAGAPRVRPQWPAAQAVRRRHPSQRSRGGQRAARMTRSASGALSCAARPASASTCSTILIVRSTAPRSRSHARARAASPIADAGLRCVSRRITAGRAPRHSRRAARAFASIRSSATSAILNVCGPTMTGLPSAAGSSRLWPPTGTRLPPTKATSARRVESQQLAHRVDDETLAAFDRRLRPRCASRVRNPSDRQAPTTGLKRSGWRGAISSRASGKRCSTAACALSTGISSPSCVLAAIQTGRRRPQRLAQFARRFGAGSAGTGMSNFRLPITASRSTARTEGAQAFGIDRRLRGDETGAADRATRQRPHRSVAAQAALGQARIGHHDRNSRARGR